MMSKEEQAKYSREWRAKNREAYNGRMREYQRTRRAGGWPPGKAGQAWERRFVNALRDVLGLDDMPVTNGFE